MLVRALLTRGPSRVRLLARRAAWRLLRGHLPPFVVRHPNGWAFSVPRGDTMYWLIFMDGEWEPSETAAIRGLLRSGDFAIDIGANHGWFSVVMASSVGQRGRVWAIEPLPQMISELETNFGLNPDLDVEVLPIALGAQSGQADIHLFEGLPHGHASVSTLGRGDYSTHRVAMRALDDLLADRGDMGPALVKVDVEGAELEVLKGAPKTIASDSAPIWTLEVNYETAAAFGYRPVALLELLRRWNDYETYRVTPRGLQPEREPHEAPHGAMWVCVPPGHWDRAEALVVL